MPPPTTSKRKKQPSAYQTAYNLTKKYFSFEFVKYLIFDPSALPVVSVLILFGELLLNVIVINRVNYTEIDWKAYMQECEGFLNGTTNYALLKGDTGPLVYPAAFVYIYTALYFITSYGQNVRLAQYIFAGIYLLQMWLVLRLYSKSRKVPPYVLVISAFTSYRIHSIYVLRLFNDPVAMVFLYAALNLFMDQRWSWGSICFSLGVGVKMNILLFAPALLLFYLVNLGSMRTVVQLFICGVVQLLLGLPFLLTYPWQYIRGSFDLGRIFEHKWTVNYRFLAQSIFEHKVFHLSLLALHLLLIFTFARPCYVYFRNYVRLRELQSQLQPQLAHKNQELKRARKENQSKVNKKNENDQDEAEELTSEQQAFLKSFEKSLQKSTGLKEPPTTKTATQQQQQKASSEETQVSIHFEQCTQLALLPFFVCNLIGVVCARSLHYQFYVWYFHSLPYLTWSTPYSLGLRYLLLGLIEYSWNTYPSTNFSSLTLHFCHVLLLAGIGFAMFKATRQSATATAIATANEQSSSTQIRKEVERGNRRKQKTK